MYIFIRLNYSIQLTIEIVGSFTPVRFRMKYLQNQKVIYRSIVCESHWRHRHLTSDMEAIYVVSRLSLSRNGRKKCMRSQSINRGDLLIVELSWAHPFT